MSAEQGAAPKLRFPGFEGNWETCPLSRFGITVIDGDRGKNYPNGDDFSADGYCLFLNAKNVTSSGFAFNEVSFISQEKDKSLSKGKLQLGDVVLSTRGTVGNIALFGPHIPFCHMRINSGMVILRPALSKVDKMKLEKEDGQTVYLEFFDSANPLRNRYQVTQQIAVEGSYKNRYDVTILVNGLPLAQIELKRRGLEMKEAFNQIQRYQKHSYWSAQGLFHFVQLFVISNGMNTKYYANARRQSFKQTFYWAAEDNQTIRELKPFAAAFLNRAGRSGKISQGGCCPGLGLQSIGCTRRKRARSVLARGRDCWRHFLFNGAAFFSASFWIRVVLLHSDPRFSAENSKRRH